MKIFTQQFSGTSIPNAYYKQSIGFPVNSVLVWNNSPITFTISNTPGGSPYAIVPPFFSMSVSVPSFGGISISGDGTTPYATSTLQIQVQDEVAGIPFAGQFGPGGWGSGSAPSVLTPVNPGDQILWWQVQQVINLLTGAMPGQVVKLANELILLDPVTNTVKRLVAIANGANSDLAIKNNADTVDILTIDDLGNLTLTGNVQIPGSFILLDPVTNTTKRLVAIPNGTNSDLAIKNNADNANLLLLDDAGNVTALGQISGASASISGALSAASANIAGVTVDTIGDVTAPGRISSQHCGGFNQPLTTGVTLNPPALISNPNAPANTWFEVDLAGIVPPSASAVTVTVEYAESSAVNSNPAIYLGDASTSTIWIQSFSLNANRAQITATVPTAGFLGVYIASGYAGAPSNSFNVYVTHYEGDS